MFLCEYLACCSCLLINSTVGPLSVTPTTTTSMAMFTTASDSMTNTPITTSTELDGGGGNWNCYDIKPDDKVFSISQLYLEELLLG